MEKEKQLFRSFNRPLEISRKARDSHIPTAQLRSGWKSGKPKSGFPLFHAELRNDDDCLVFSNLKKSNSKSDYHEKGARRGRHTPWFSGSRCIGNQNRFQDHSSIGKCCAPSIPDYSIP
jgi:hypothetical protein